jgi:hypothetical protein
MEDQASVGAVSGEFVTETFEYDGGRQVTVYVPPDPPEAVVFAGDGQFISQWGEVLKTADVPSTMIVGVHGLADETPRLQEYSPAFAPERFAAHARFFVEDVRRWTESRFGVALPAGRTAAGPRGARRGLDRYTRLISLSEEELRRLPGMLITRPLALDLWSVAHERMTAQQSISRCHAHRARAEAVAAALHDPDRP